MSAKRKMRWKSSSLRVRLLAGTLTWLLLGVALAGWGLYHLFEQYVTEQFEEQLVVQLNHLSGAVDWSSDGQPQVTLASADERFNRPLSGLYWQVDTLGEAARAASVRSRSLWDQALGLPAESARYPRQGQRFLRLTGAQGEQLLAVVRVVQLPEDDAPPLRLTVAGDTRLLAEPLQHFTRLLLASLAMLALALALAVVVQLQLALRPLKLLHQRLVAVRSGSATQLSGEFPREIEPLVTEFNHVLTTNAEMVQRARTQAGNLAHAVYTPLTVLDNAAASGDPELPRLVREQVDSARRQVETHLARARAAAAVRATGLATPVLPVARALLRTALRLHHERSLSFDLADTAQDLAFRGEEQDLYELLGNLIDNAGKWAQARVIVDVQRENDRLQLTVDDDGPGIPLEARTRMFQRGVQLDERRAGSGLGLDIVRELAETYGGSVCVETSALGGARLVLELPEALV